MLTALIVPVLVSCHKPTPPVESGDYREKWCGDWTFIYYYQGAWGDPISGLIHETIDTSIYLGSISKQGVYDIVARFSDSHGSGNSLTITAPDSVDEIIVNRNGGEYINGFINTRNLDITWNCRGMTYNEHRRIIGIKLLD